MQTSLYIGFAFVMGMIMSIYLPMNSSVARYIGSPVTASMIFFLIAFLTSILLFLVFGDFETIYNFRDVPVYFYLTGFVSALVILGTTFLIPHIGARKFFILLVAGQIVMAILVSHFGVLESPKDPISTQKLIGAALVMAGVVVSTN